MRTPDPSLLRSLPSEISRFIGRRQDLKRLVKLQAANRLLTLAGPGGCGKTRLAIRLARRRERVLPGGAWFLDMAVQSAADALLDGLKLLMRRKRTPERLVLLLDTCDVDITTSARVVATVLREYQRIEILATSREPLGLPGEVVWRVPPLSVPDDKAARAHQLQTTEAWQLYIDRASTVGRASVSLAEHALAIARVCRAVNGLPLAVELAALKAGDLGVAVVADRATTPLVLGLPGRRDAPARQRSIRANLDWSYVRLTDTEQPVLRRLAVFGGDWTIDMARAVCCEAGAPDADVAQVDDAIKSLVHKSLVHVSRRGGGPRSELLEISRQYGRDLLERCGEAASIRRRHLEWFVARAEAEAPQILDDQHARRLERDLPELRLALEWALKTGETELGLRLATAAFTLWYLRSLSVEGCSWFDRLLAQPLAAVRPEVIASARAWHTQLMLQQGDCAGAEQQLEAVIAEQCARSDETGASLSLMLLGNVMLWSGRLERAGQLFDEVLDPHGRASNRAPYSAIYYAARVAWETNQPTRARAFTKRLLHLARQRHAVMLARANQIGALLASEVGDWAEAFARLDEAERHLRRIDYAFGFVDLLMDRGHLLLRSDQAGAAHTAFVNAAALARATGSRVRVVRAIEGVACVMADSQPSLCVQLAAAASASRSAMHAAAWPREARLLQAALSRARSHMRTLRDTAMAGTESTSYAEAWQMGAMLLESEAATTAISTLSASPPKAIADIPATLTGREWEIAQLFATGASARQIAERLTLSRDTVRTHLDRATAKLGLHSRVQLATWVAQSQAAVVT